MSRTINRKGFEMYQVVKWHHFAKVTNKQVNKRTLCGESHRDEYNPEYLITRNEIIAAQYEGMEPGCPLCEEKGAR